MANAGIIASIESRNRNGWETDKVPRLPQNLERLADSIDLPWRDAGARNRKPVKVAPHKCRRTIRKTKIKGEYVKVEWRH